MKGIWFSRTISCPEEREPRATPLSPLSFFLRLFFSFFPWGRKWRYLFVNTVGTFTKKLTINKLDNIRYFYVISTDCDQRQNFRRNNETFKILANLLNSWEGCQTAITGSQPTLKTVHKRKIRNGYLARLSQPLSIPLAVSSPNLSSWAPR